MEFPHLRAAIRSSTRLISNAAKQPSNCPSCGSRIVTRSLATATGRKRRDRVDTRLRRDMWDWINGPGAVFKDPGEAMPNYLDAYNADGSLKVSGDDLEEGGSEPENARETNLRPFPLNREFTSFPVLNEDTKEEVWHRVVVRKQTIRQVSMEMKVDMRRVAACTRMKMIEKQWMDEGKLLAYAYAEKITEMLPRSGLQGKTGSHEDVNELPTHPYTDNQIFYPTSESRQFTREDAARAFNRNLLPADKRIQHPIAVEMARAEAQGANQGELRSMMHDACKDEVKAREEKSKQREVRKASRTTIVKGRTGGAEFRFKAFSAEQTPLGWRYGNPHDDRKKGLSKIPKTVE